MQTQRIIDSDRSWRGTRRGQKGACQEWDGMVEGSEQYMIIVEALSAENGHSFVNVAFVNVVWFGKSWVESVVPLYYTATLVLWRPTLFRSSWPRHSRHCNHGVKNKYYCTSHAPLALIVTSNGISRLRIKDSCKMGLIQKMIEAPSKLVKSHASSLYSIHSSGTISLTISAFEFLVYIFQVATS